MPNIKSLTVKNNKLLIDNKVLITGKINQAAKNSNFSDKVSIIFDIYIHKFDKSFSVCVTKKGFTPPADWWNRNSYKKS